MWRAAGPRRFGWQRGNWRASSEHWCGGAGAEVGGLALDDGAGAALEGEFELVGRSDNSKTVFAGEFGDGLDFGKYGAWGEVAGGDVGGGFGGSE